VPINKTTVDHVLAQLRRRHGHAGHFCFFTDLDNLPSIVHGYRLLNRNECLARGLIRVDCASAAVLTAAPAWVHDCVRLYFAPLGPMLYRTEGIKRLGDEWPHCPRPVYLVFKPDVLLIRGARFSDGNMSSSYTDCPERPSDEYFASLPFDDIYGRGVLPSGIVAKGQVNRRRQAEVLIPTELSLGYLERMIFRSAAERALAYRDVSDLAAKVATEVDESWFYASTRGRPYLRTFGDSELDIANEADGDELVQVNVSAKGVVEAYRCVFRNGTWTEWKLVRISRSTLPNPGWARFFLNGWRVAEQPL
jgi:hypothetical protein